MNLSINTELRKELGPEVRKGWDGAERKAWGLEALAKALGEVSVAFLRKEIKLKHLNATRLGRRVLITTEEVDRYLRERAGK